ncbi:MAG: hypothetical protein M1536_00980 [Firmicutes bacterium]|nr:hypothetical protein [Bacillota bacterium]
MEEIKIATLENEIEAQLMDSILTEQNIPHLVRSYQDSAYPGVYQSGIYQLENAWGCVYASLEHGDEIKEILADLRKDKDQT